MATTTPRSLGSNMLNNLVESHVGSNRDAIKADLLDKVVYDDLPCSNICELIKSIMISSREKASKKTPDDLEKEENEDKASDTKKEEKSGNHGSAEEKKMYDPLVCLFSYIADFEQATPHKFQKTNSMLKVDEPHTFGFLSCSPDH